MRLKANAYERALAAVGDSGAEIVTCSTGSPPSTTRFAELEDRPATASVDEAHARVGPDTVAKILFTSGSTGRPKGVINTQRMLCANQEMVRTVLPLLADDPPVLCDWLPWNHTFGGNHNFGIVLYNGGTLYIDDGKPTPEGFDTTIANLKDVATTAYFNVPRGYDLLVPRLRADREFRLHFFSRLKMLFCAAAALRQQVADDLEAAALDARGTRIPLVTGLGATESAPFAICAGDADFTGGRIGVPAPGVELKLAPAGDKLEGRLRGPNITPGYWRDEELTARRLRRRRLLQARGRARFRRSGGSVEGLRVRRAVVGRFQAVDRHVGAGRAAAHGAARAPGRPRPRRGDCRARSRFRRGADLPAPHVLRSVALEELRREMRRLLQAFAVKNPGSSTLVRRAIVLDRPPAIDAQEVTDKGSVNQKAVLANRAGLVDLLYGPAQPGIVCDISEGGGTRGAAHSA